MTREEAISLAVCKDLMEPGVRPKDILLASYRSKQHAEESNRKAKLVFKDLTTSYEEEEMGVVVWHSLKFSAAKAGSNGGRRLVAAVMR